jgi:hypothetical protein
MSTLIALVAVVLFATLASAYAATVRSASLRRKFESLGKIPGRSMEEILRHVGQPSKRAKLDGSRELLYWRRINFEVALTFADGVCESIDYEAKA